MRVGFLRSCGLASALAVATAVSLGSSVFAAGAIPAPSPQTGSSSSTPVGWLADVSCPSVTLCLALGQISTPSKPGYRQLVEHWNGTRWKLHVAPRQPRTAQALLFGISCPSSTHCMAVGGAGRSPWVEQWNGTEWEALTAPKPAGTTAGFSRVQCLSKSWCMALGSSSDPKTNQSQPLFEKWNGTAWRIVESPEVGGVGLSGSFNGLSCSSHSACFAVGSVPTGPSGASAPMVERWDGISWSGQQTPTLNTFTAGLNGVSCMSSTFCIAVGGTSFYGGGGSAALIERWNGSKWSTMKAPSEPARLDAVSCTTSNFCSAVGLGNADEWNGSIWNSRFVRPPQGKNFTEMFAVACSSPNACSAVGAAYAIGSDYVPGAEHWDGTKWRPRFVPLPGS